MKSNYQQEIEYLKEQLKDKFVGLKEEVGTKRKPGPALASKIQRKEEIDHRARRQKLKRKIHISLTQEMQRQIELQEVARLFSTERKEDALVRRLDNLIKLEIKRREALKVKEKVPEPLPEVKPSKIKPAKIVLVPRVSPKTYEKELDYLTNQLSKKRAGIKAPEPRRYKVTHRVISSELRHLMRQELKQRKKESPVKREDFTQELKFIEGQLQEDSLGIETYQRPIRKPTTKPKIKEESLKTPPKTNQQYMKELGYLKTQLKKLKK